MNARTNETSVDDPRYLKIALYKPKKVKIGIEKPIATISAHHSLPSKSLHLSTRTPKDSQTLKKQIATSMEITIALFTKRDKFKSKY